MTIRKLLTAISIACVCAPAFADGDADAGKTKFDAACQQCHYADDFSGQAEADLAGTISAASKGEIQHPTDISDLSSDDSANLAAFLASQ